MMPADVIKLKLERC